MQRFGSETGRAWVVQLYDIELFNINGVQQILIGTDLDQNIFYTLMRRHLSRSVRSHNKSTSQPRQQRRTNNKARCSQYQHIQNALETLDNHHALALLKTYQELSQDQYCLRTRLSHQLQQHQLCMLFAKKALQKLPNCKSCLNVYLSHSQEIPLQDLPLKEELIAAFQNEFPQLFSLIPKLPSLTPNYMHYASMTNDLKHQGGELQKIGIVQVNSGRKIIAMQKIFRNQEILFVPKTHLITLEIAKELPLVQKLLQSRVLLRSPKHTQLSIFLLQHFQLANSSLFASYLKTLPNQFSHFPINYTEELLTELKGTSFLEQINQKKLDMRKDYDAILTVDQTFARFQFKKFVEARLLVSSRVFGILVDQVKTDALVPVADMLNHKLPKQTSWYYCNHKQGFVIQSLKQIEAGCQVFDSYGQKCNSRFLLNYGFVLANNPHNQISLDIDLTNLFHGLPRSTKIRLNKCLDSKGFEEMLGLLRATLDFTQNQQQSEQEGNILILQSHKKTTFKNVQLQIKAWKLIQELVSERLKEYPHTVIEDKRILKNCKDNNLANVIILRKGEKQVLLFYLAMSKRVVRYLESRGRRGDVTPYQSYISSINAFGNCQSQN